MDFLITILVTPLQRYPVLAGIVVLVVFYILARIVWNLRLYVIRYKYILGRKWITLEVRVPRDIERSPEAMELFLINAMYQSGGVGNPYKKYWEGKVLNWSSLEIVSFGGSVHFYIHCWSWMKDLIEAQMYGQFPQVEVKEVEDYTNRIPPYRRESDFNVYGGTFKLEENDALPIKTYRDWMVDKKIESLDPNQQIDPLNALLESMSALRSGEEWWLQIIMMANKGDSWKNKAQDLIQDLRDQYEILETKTDTNDRVKVRPLTQGQKDTIEAIERSLAKFTFKVGIRTVYLAKKGHYDRNKHLFIKNMFASFAAQDMNRLKRVTYTGFDNPWEDFDDFLNIRKKARLLEDYRQREYFNLYFRFSWFDVYMKYIDPYSHNTLVMTTEEIATLWHFPSRALQTPGVERIESRTSEPPSNLPM